VTVSVGTPSATSAKFAGRCQVCVDTAGGRQLAVVATDDGFECRESSESNRGNDQGLTDPDSYCDEVPDESEAIVGWLDPDDPADADCVECIRCTTLDDCTGNHDVSPERIGDDLEA
jgi:hypothetical protein